MTGHSNGIIRTYGLPGLDGMVEIAAHVRWITQMVPVKGGFVSAAEDGFLHLWRFFSADGTDQHGDGAARVRYVASLQLADGLMTSGIGACHDDDGEGGTTLLATVYDQPQFFRLAVYQQSSIEDAQ